MAYFVVKKGMMQAFQRVKYCKKKKKAFEYKWASEKKWRSFCSFAM